MMKMLLVFVLLLGGLSGNTQTLRAYESKVISGDNRPVAGVTVLNINKVLKTSTNSDGFFSIQVATGDSLRLTANGYKPTIFIITDLPQPSITLVSADTDTTLAIYQPVRHIYTTVPASLNLSSSDAVYSKEILKNPVVSYRNALSGRLTGLYTLQSSGVPGNDGAGLTLRGRTPITIIDGVVAPLTTFDLEEIESITVQKDALGTAMLGVRGSPGAIIITTKKGQEGKQLISFTAQTGIQKSLGFPKTLNAYDYARLRNQALKNDGIDSANSGLYYTNTALDAYRTGSDPYNYPNTDYLAAVTNKTSMLSRYTLSTSGGNRFARYFVSLEHLNQGGFFKTSDSNTYNTNNTFKTYVIRSNVDINITNKLSGGIYLLGRILSGNEPGVSGIPGGSSTTSVIINNILNTPANAYPILNANGTFGGNQLFQNNVLAQTINSGYRQTYKRDVLVNMYLKRTLDEVTPGLWMQAKASYYSTLSETNYRDKSFAVFQAGTSGTYSQFGSNGSQVNSNGIDYQNRSDYEEFSVGYNHTFNKVHGINALLMANRDNSPSGTTAQIPSYQIVGQLGSGYSQLLPYTIVGTSGRVSYNYAGKYIAEIAYGINGSNRYPDGGRTKIGFFPSFGLGWNVEQENFMKTQTWLTRLKLYGSYGKTGNDNPGYFVYYPQFGYTNVYSFGTTYTNATGVAESYLPNRNIAPEKATKLNLGVDGAVLNNRLSFSVEYFRNKYYDLLMQRGSSSSTIGNTYPLENIGQNRYTGWESRIGWQQNIGKFQYFISANASTLKTKVLYMDEVARPNNYSKLTGQPIGQVLGYQANGLFQSAAELTSSAVPIGYRAQLGDIKYQDLNNDGVIDYRDLTGIYKTKPLVYYGVSVGLSYKGFDISALLQGVENRNIYLGGTGFFSYQNNGTGQAYSTALNSWTPSTAATATQPRLSYGENINNNAVSTYWVKSGDYFRLRNAEIGYSLPASLIGKIKLQTVRIFINGYNLFTHTAADLNGRDPESYFNTYPIQKLYNFGINVKF